MAWRLRLNDAGGRQEHLQLLDAAFHECLLVLGSFVFGVLDEFAAFHSLVETVSYFLPLDRFQVIELFLKLLEAFLGEELGRHNDCPTIEEFASHPGCNIAPPQRPKATILYHASEWESSGGGGALTPTPDPSP